MLNGFVFFIMGLQLPYLLAGIQTIRLGRLVVLGLFLSAVVILLRLLWMYPGAWMAHFIRRRLLHQQVPLWSWRSTFIVGRTGMRGVVALAAAISLPQVLHDGTAFPHRNEMIFLTFCVIFVTLVLQGLTLPSFIRWLGLGGQLDKNPEEHKARQAMAQAAVAYLAHTRDDDQPEFKPVYDELIRFERHRLNMIDGNSSEETGYRPEDYLRLRQLSSQVRALQRAAILHLRNQNEVTGEVMRRLEHELDLVEARFSASEHV